MKSGPGGSRTRITTTPGWRRPVGPQAQVQSGELGSNPRCPASKAGGLPLSYPLNQWTAGESHPDFRLATAASSSSTSSPGSSRPAGSRTRTTAIPERCAAVTPQDHEVAEVGVEPTDTRLSTWPLCLFAYPAMKQVADPGVAPDCRTYEARPGTGPPAEKSSPGRSRTFVSSL